MIFDSEISSWYLVISLIFLVGLLTKEIFRANKQRLIYRLIALVLIAVGIIGLIIQPKYSVEISPKKAVVLTDGYETNILDSLVQQHVGIDTVSFHQFNSKDFQEIFLLGNGVESYEFEYFENIKTHFHPSKIPYGITAITYNPKPVQLKNTVVKGNCHCEGNSKIVLVEPQGRIDSIENSSQFEFDLIPKIKGQQMYYLEYWKDSVVIERNPLPIDVQVPEKINVLILNSFPTFESNHIKQFLASKNHAVVIRNRISTDRFSNEFVNTNRLALGKLGATLLHQFDLLIIDQKELTNLNRSEMRNLQSAIQNGMGLLLHGVNSKSFAKGMFVNFKVVKKKPQKITLPTFENAVLHKSEFEFSTTGNIFPIVEIKNTILSAYQLFGQGKIGVVLMDNTYQLNIRGNELAYAHFWSKHIDELAAKEKETIDMKLFPKTPIEKQPLEVEIIDLKSINPNVLINDVTVSMAQDVNIKEQWKGKFWPDKKGWHQLIADSVVYNFYVFKNNDWKTLRSKQKLEMNQRFFLNSSYSNTKKTRDKTIPLYFAFLLFLIGASYLWLEAKLS